MDTAPFEKGVLMNLVSAPVLPVTVPWLVVVCVDVASEKREVSWELEDEFGLYNDLGCPCQICSLSTRT